MDRTASRQQTRQPIDRPTERRTRIDERRRRVEQSTQTKKWPAMATSTQILATITIRMATENPGRKTAGQADRLSVDNHDREDRIKTFTQRHSTHHERWRVAVLVCYNHLPS